MSSKPPPPAYHLFERPGERFVYFVDRDCSFRIEEPTYILLQRALNTSLDTAATTLIAEGLYDVDLVASILAEAKRLEAVGLFKPMNATLSDAQMEQALGHRYTTPWTRLELALAETCNLACKYCYCSAVRDMPNQGLMTEEVARKAIDWLFEAACDEKELGIVLFGGEPLLNKPVFKFVMDYSDAIAKERGKTIRYSMTTNATLMDDMVIDYIKKHNFGLMVSLDGPPEIHDAQCPTRNGGPSFQLAAEGIKRLMKRRRSVTVRCTVTERRPDLTELVEYFTDFGFSRVALGFANNPMNPTAVDLGLPSCRNYLDAQFERLAKWMFKELGKGKYPKWFPYAREIAKQRGFSRLGSQSFFKCGACRGTMTVGADGLLYPCHRFVGMKRFIMGSIDEGPDIECAKAFWRAYHYAVDANCSECWASRECNRPCPWQIAKNDGSFRMLNEHECRWIRDYIERSVSVHLRIQERYPEMYSILAGHTDERDRDCAPVSRGSRS